MVFAAGLASASGYSAFAAGTVNESWAWWAFGATGFLAMMLGLVLGAVHVIVTGILPRWAGIIAALASAALVFFNTEAAMVLVVVPAGLAWALIGGLTLKEALGDLDFGHAPAIGH
ncbi:hypothetical protein [Sinomonas gamaensis]|uniref:hypothetical protein n=1 Tax=Sinomonas gamaensis TaxID=2565624 RepID=UPI001108E569|nr:hypothetical protein [Sinomonas gamaensis]